jgi:hypothetical protein
MRNGFTKRWWRRVWVIQEVALAQAICFACGKQHIDGSDLWLSLIFLELLVHRIKPISAEEQPGGTKVAPLVTYVRTLAMLHLMLVSVHSDSGDSLYILQLFKRTAYHHKPQLLVTDSRDRFFSIISLIKKLCSSQ